MSYTTVPLSSSQHTSCVLESLFNGGSYLSCDVKKNWNPTTFVPLEIVRGSRPPQCELPHVANTSPMLDCSYRYRDLSRCGCPTLDPNKNPQLWGAYVESVKNAVKSRLHQTEITLTIFASGYLLQDCELLDQLFKDEALRNWQGTLNLQFVDLKYDFNHTNASQENCKKGNSIDWSLLAPAIVLGVGGGAGVIYGLTTKQEKARKLALVVGIIVIAVAVILICASAKNQKGTAANPDINTPIMKTIDQFLEEIAQHTPFNMHTDFFPNANACIEKQNKSDAVLGYDIDNTFPIFDHLRKENLKADGEVILVTKDLFPTQEVKKVMRMAHGPYGNYQFWIFP